MDDSIKEPTNELSNEDMIQYIVHMMRQQESLMLGLGYKKSYLKIKRPGLLEPVDVTFEELGEVLKMAPRDELEAMLDNCLRTNIELRKMVESGEYGPLVEIPGFTSSSKLQFDSADEGVKVVTNLESNINGKVHYEPVEESGPKWFTDADIKHEPLS